MTPAEYIQKALGTESPYRFEATGDVTPRLEHGVMGAVTEVGELMDAIKKSKIYGRALGRVNLVEEIWEKNINKLRQRYPEKYSDASFDQRDVAAERKILQA